MFADNQRVSGLQVERQLLLVFLGPVMIWGVTGLNGREGVWSILLGSGILCLWVFFFYVRSMSTVIRKNIGENG